MSKIKTKFKCPSVALFEHGEAVQLEPVTNGSKENKKALAENHAQGEMKLRIDKGAELEGFFRPGEEYFLEFSEAPKTVVPATPANVN